MEEQVFNLMDALTSPMLTFTTSWADCIPKRILGLISLARLKALMQREEMATLPEVVAYLFTRTMEAPMSGEWVNIYTHVSCKVCEDYFNEDHWGSVTHSRTLNSDEQRYLKDLRVWIYDRRRKALKERIKSDKSKLIPSTIIEAELQPQKPLQQMQLQFNF